MRLGEIFSIKGINWREFAPAFVVVVNSLIWYILTYSIFNSALSEHVLAVDKPIILGIYYAGFAFSAIIGGLILPRSRKNGLLIWMVIGIASPILVSFISPNSLPINTLISALIGTSTGIGLPSTLAYFAENTKINKRGFQGGLTWVVMGFGALLIGAFSNSSIDIGIPMLVGWRLIGVILFVLLLRNLKTEFEKKEPKLDSFKKILTRRDLLLYLLPWIMFSIINFVETPFVNSKFTVQFGIETVQLIGLVQLALSGIFALVGGIFADRVGRKRIVIVGFILYGIEYAFLSLAGGEVSSYVYIAFDGAAWGMFASVFFMTLWGDLAGESSKDKYYILGGLPYFLAGFLSEIIVPPTIAPVSDPSLVMTFSIASFFLFIAVLPLIYAPETLPDKIMKDRDLKTYVEKALKQVKKEPNNKETEKNDDGENNSKNDRFDEEAKKLADKYY